MNIYKSDKYKNYGSAPRNEYTTANAKNNINSVAVSELDTQEDASMYKQSSPKQRMQYPPISGWKCSGKINGWRAELASRQDESIEARRYYNYVVEKPIFLNKRKSANDQENDVREELNLICIYKADTRRETLSNMQAARIYIDDPDMLVILDSTVDKLDNMTESDFSEIAFESNLCVLS